MGHKNVKVELDMYHRRLNSLYYDTFFSQCSDRLHVKRIGLPLDCRHCQGALAASVVEDHDAPFLAEIGGVH